MFGRRNFVFGKKSQPAQAVQPVVLAPTPDEDGVTRVIPKAMWDGPEGALLKELGMSPDDPSNLAMTPQRADAILDAKKSEQDKFVAAINAMLPAGCSVIPWAMLPWSLWGRSNSEFLIKMGFFPVEPWNTMLLAEDEPSAVILGLPVHPRGMFEGLEDASDRLLSELRKELAELHAETGVALQRGWDQAALDRYNDASAGAKANIHALSHYLGQQTFGEAAWARHKELFGAALGWPGCE